MLTLSKNLTFSLAIVTMFVLGFAFAPVALAHEGVTHEALAAGVASTPAAPGEHGDGANQHQHVGAVPEPDLSVTDVSEAGGNQLEIYTAILRSDVTTANLATQTLIDTEIITEDDLDPARNVDFYIRLKTGYALLDIYPAGTTVTGVSAGDPRGADVDDADADTPGFQVSAANQPKLHISDLAIGFYDIDGAAVVQDDGIDQRASVIAHRNAAFPDGRNFKVTIAADDIVDTARYMTVVLPAGSFTHADPVDVRASLIGGKVLEWNKQSNSLRFELVNADVGDPDVVSIVRVVPTAAVATSRFTQAAVSGPFDVRVTFTEEPNLAMDGGNIKIGDLPFELENAKITSVVKGAPFYGLESNTPAERLPAASEGNYSAANPPDDPPDPTGRDSRYHPYLLTITPNLETANDVVIRVKPFNDLVKPANRFNPPSNLASALHRSVLRVKVHAGAVVGTSAAVFEATDAYKALKPSPHEYELPGGTLIPANGYLVIASGSAAQSGFSAPTADKYKDNDDRARADNQTDFDFMHNVLHGKDLKFPGNNLAGFFRNGATIRLLYQNAAGRPAAKNKKKGTDSNDAVIAAGDVLINEIMWGRDESLGTDAGKSQWIELHNTTAADISIDPKEWVLSFGTASNYTTEVDSVSNAGATGWDQPGQSGATSITATTPVPSDLISMSRVADGADGTAAASWADSMRPNSGNFIGLRIGTPGGANNYPMEVTTTTTTDDTTVVTVVTPPTPVAGAADIAISEIMYSTGRGNLPQWIELTNVSASEVSLEGWDVEVENEDGSDLSITLGATTVGASEAALLVSKNGRNSGVSDDPEAEGDIRRVVNLKDLGVTGTLLSSMGFTITLVPPAAAGSSVRTDGDSAGGMDWELAMMDGDRSSLIREMNADGTYKDGAMRMSWHATTGTGRYGTYYGHPSDMGTPGYVMGGPLPVELSMFYPARDKLTGQVVITWETQSELNNAGFYIKRSEAKKGKFVVINPTMIPGAGTTAEKQSYTHTDTTAKPNVLYYYQIEDVSLDGKRATLTGAHRLRGHIGAAGKVTTIWGELKAQE